MHRYAFITANRLKSGSDPLRRKRDVPETSYDASYNRAIGLEHRRLLVSPHTFDVGITPDPTPHMDASTLWGK